jgi:hypothetical protein
MATREEIGLALDVINMINQMGRGIRASANGMLVNQDAKIETILNDSGKYAKLVSGLTALGVTVASLASDKTEIVAGCQYILDNVDNIVQV